MSVGVQSADARHRYAGRREAKLSALTHNYRCCMMKYPVFVRDIIIEGLVPSSAATQRGVTNR